MMETSQLKWCICCLAFAADPDTGRGKLCLLCVMHRCPCAGTSQGEVPAATRAMVEGWGSEELPPDPGPNYDWHSEQVCRRVWGAYAA